MMSEPDQQPVTALHRQLVPDLDLKVSFMTIGIMVIAIIIKLYKTNMIINSPTFSQHGVRAGSTNSNISEPPARRQSSPALRTRPSHMES